MSPSPLMPVEEVIARLLAMAEAQRVQDSEPVALGEARQRVLASDLVATLDLPPWPNSAMDGYALNLEGWDGQPLAVSQRIFAGQAPEPLLPGTCARIFTGAPLPEGANSIEMQENVEQLDDGRIRFKQPLKAGQNIRAQGQENRAGQVLLRAGKRLGPSNWPSPRPRVVPICRWCGDHGWHCCPPATSWPSRVRPCAPAASTTAIAPCSATG